MYIVLLSKREDSYDRYWVSRDSLEDARKIASEYTKDNKYSARIIFVEHYLE